MKGIDLDCSDLLEQLRYRTALHEQQIEFIKVSATLLERLC